jgi:hypothetical protein
MKTTFIAFATVGLSLAVATAQNHPAKPAPGGKPDGPREEFQAVVKEYDAALKRYEQAIRAATTADERQRIDREKYPFPTKYVARCLALAEKNPTNAVAVDAWIWVVAHSFSVTEKSRAISRLAQDHSLDPKLGTLAGRLANVPGPATEKILEAILEGNPDRAARGKACFGLANLLKRKAELVRMLQKSDLSQPVAQEQLDKGYLQELKKSDPEKTAQAAERYCERTMASFADINYFGDKTLGDAAKATLFELRFLCVGRVAPDIEGEDVDGKKFKLSDYRGKVVLLDYWGHW